MITKKISKVILLSLVVAIIWVGQVMANSFNMVVTPNTKTLKAGETVTVTIGLANIDAGELGINTVETQISYDSDVFETVTQDEVKSANNWSLTYKGESNGGKILGVILASGVKENQESIGTITLRVKASTTKKETTIKFTNVTTNDGTTLITDSDKEIKLQIGESSNQTNSGEATTNTGEDKSSTNVTGKSQDKTTTKQVIPAAGIKSILIVTAIAVLVISAIVCVIKIKKSEI